MSSQSFDPKSVALVVITYYPSWYKGQLKSIKHSDKVRGDLALEFFHLANKLRYTVVCVDGTSSKAFKKELSLIEGIKVVKRISLARSPSKRQGIRIAAEIEGIKVIVLTEAEKVSLLHSLPQITLPILTGKAAIVVPKRENTLFKSTYPDYMYESEVEGNRIYNEELISHGLLPKDMADLDTFFGPRAFRNDKNINELFLSKTTIRLKREEFGEAKLFDMEEYSNVQFSPIVQALQQGIKVKSVEVPFSYPTIQKENETVGAKSYFIMKRKLQRMSILISLMHFISYLEREKRR